MIYQQINNVSLIGDEENLFLIFVIIGCVVEVVGVVVFERYFYCCCVNDIVIGRVYLNLGNDIEVILIDIFLVIVIVGRVVNIIVYDEVIIDIRIIGINVNSIWIGWVEGNIVDIQECLFIKN